MSVIKIAAGVFIGNMLTLVVLYVVWGVMVASALHEAGNPSPTVSPTMPDMSRERACTEARRMGTPEREIPDCS